MSKQDESRRQFLVRAGMGVGAIASTSLAPDTVAQNREHSNKVKAEAAPTAHAHSIDGHGAFFNPENAATVAALAERIMPGAPGKPGATEAGVLNYIDLALAGAYADLQEFYRHGLAQLDAYCRSTRHEPFARLSAGQQDEVITALEQGKATGFAWPSSQAFFETLRTHTMEGMFADPVYGGNKDFAGWRLVGFPGAQAIFTPADMQGNQPFTRAPITGLQAQARLSSPKDAKHRTSKQ